jgi:alpha-galactosidase
LGRPPAVYLIIHAKLCKIRPFLELKCVETEDKIYMNSVGRWRKNRNVRAHHVPSGEC